MHTPELEIEEAPPVTEEELDRMVTRNIDSLPRATPEQIQEARENLATREQNKASNAGKK